MDFLTVSEISDPTMRRIAQANTSHQDGNIYFVSCRRFLKIGYATNVNSRLSALQTSTPFTMNLERHLPGTKMDESRFHKLLEKHAVRGEWFKYNDEVEDIIDLLYDYQFDVAYHTTRATDTLAVLALVEEIPVCGFWIWLERMKEGGNV